MGERGPVLRHVTQLQPFALPREQDLVVCLLYTSPSPRDS